VRGEGTSGSCSYAEKVEGKNPTRLNPRSDAEDMRKRINRLENSILSMMSKDGTTAKLPVKPRIHVTVGSAMDDVEAPHEAVGQQVSIDSRSTHWDAILNDVSNPFIVV
jgi:hypothetical protein